MPESLRQKQSRFLRLTLKLMAYAHEQGYELTYGHSRRCEACPVGRWASLHKDSLALDLNLFKDGKYLKNSIDHKPLGEYWESLDPDCSWGGRFGESSPGAGDGWDGNHYSLKHNGRR